MDDVEVGTDFAGADLGDDHWDGRGFEGCDFTDADLSELMTTGCTFVDCDFTRADLSRSRHERSSFVIARFVETRLVDAGFVGCKLTGTVFDRVGARGLALDGGDFSSVSFGATRLGAQRLSGARLTDANLVDTDLTAPDLTGAGGFPGFQRRRLSVLLVGRSLRSGPSSDRAAPVVAADYIGRSVSVAPCQ